MHMPYVLLLYIGLFVVSYDANTRNVGYIPTLINDYKIVTDD